MDAPARRARVVWSQDEPDGSVVGMEFLDADDSIPPPSVTPKDPSVSSDSDPEPDPEPEPDSD
jgi:hypothetical protein